MAVAALNFAVGCSQTNSCDGILTTLDRQVDAWNQGDVEGFMQGYWKSEELRFVTPEGTTRGWQATLDRYRAKYPTRELMGRLSFEQICVAQKGPEVADVLGRYRLDRQNDVLTGWFTLEMRKIGAEWVIVRDFTVGDPVNNKPSSS